MNFLNNTNSDEDENPYDFVAQFRKLKQEKRKKNVPNNNKPTNKTLTLNDFTSSDTTDIIISNEKCSTKNSEPICPATSSSQLCVTRICSRNISRSNRQMRGNYRILGPTLCIGDFDDGYNIPPLTLPNKKNSNDDDKDLLVEFEKTSKKEDEEVGTLALNRIINVKVCWRKIRIHKFPLRMFQEIKSIYEHFAELENIEKSFISLELHNKLLSPSDTPDSINYKIADFIDGDIVYYEGPHNTPKIAEIEEPKAEEINLKIKQKDIKHPLIISIKKTDKMQVLYIKLSEKLDLDLESFTLEFDGDIIKSTDTLESLELEGDECLELFQKNNNIINIF